MAVSPSDIEYLGEGSQSVVRKVEDRECLGLPGPGQARRLAGLHARLEQSRSLLSCSPVRLYIILVFLQQRGERSSVKYFRLRDNIITPTKSIQ